MRARLSWVRHDNPCCVGVWGVHTGDCALVDDVEWFSADDPCPFFFRLRSKTLNAVGESQLNASVQSTATQAYLFSTIPKRTDGTLLQASNPSRRLGESQVYMYIYCSGSTSLSPPCHPPKKGGRRHPGDSPFYIICIIYKSG